MPENTHEEWLLSFVMATEEMLFSDSIRQKVTYSSKGPFPHYAWFEEERLAQIGRAVAEDAGASDVALKRRTVTTIATDWSDVP